MKNKGLFTSIIQEWKTPKALKENLYNEFKFDYEPCAGDKNVDDLKTEWGKRNYINPPYTTKLQNAFVKRAYEMSLRGKLSVLLIPVRTSSKRWQQYILPYASEIRFLPGRLKFNDGGGRATFDSAIIIFDGGVVSQ